MVATAPTPKASNSDPVSRHTRRKSESNKSMGTAKGTRNWLIVLYRGDAKGTKPRLATVKAKAMVASGADKALPSVVRFSSVIPAVLSKRMAVKQYDGSACKVVANILMLRDKEVVLVAAAATAAGTADRVVVERGVTNGTDRDGSVP